MLTFQRSARFIFKIRKPCAVKRKLSQLYNSHIDVHQKVQEALRDGKPLVALESTIITHGMPYPHNLTTCLEVEDIVRMHGSVPATIAILNGRIKIGLDAEDLKRLATLSGVVKCSVRDIGFIVANSLSGGTTVAATIAIANRIGLKIFATGGIGGVHREGHKTFDISADLVELGRTPIAVVSSGVKSILDIPKTLEYLETQGVCVTTYGEANGIFPDFYTQNSGCRVPYNLATPKEAANLIRSMNQLELKSGLLIGVPIMKEFAVDKDLIQSAIEEASRKAKEQNISGKDVTPFILSAITEITKGNSLNANIALIKNNAKVASQIAAELYKTEEPLVESTIMPALPVGVPVVIGASILDLTLTLVDDLNLTFEGATYDTKSKQSAGGVGRNLAEALYKLIGATHLISTVGNDLLGQNLLKLIPSAQQAGIFVDPNASTSLCSVILDRFGECKLCLGNMEIHNNVTPERILQNEHLLKQAPLIVFDANLSLDAIECTLRLAEKYKKPVFFEPTDMQLAGKPFRISNAKLQRQIKIISPNLLELVEIVGTMTGKKVSLSSEVRSDINNLLKEAKNLLSSINDHFDCIILTLGKYGVIIDAHKTDQTFFDSSGCYQFVDMVGQKERSMQYFAAENVKDATNASGAGDSFSSGFIVAMLRGETMEKCVALGFHAAKMSIKSESAVPKQYFVDESEQIEFLKSAEVYGKAI